MSAPTETLQEGFRGKIGRVPAPPLRTRIRACLHQDELDKELVAGVDDPNSSPLRNERARQLVGVRCRMQIAASLDRLLTEAHSPPRSFNSSPPIARAAIRASRPEIEAIIERLSAPAYLSARGVAMISILLTDGAGPLYVSEPVRSEALRRALEAIIDCIDNGRVYSSRRSIASA